MCGNVCMHLQVPCSCVMWLSGSPATELLSLKPTLLLQQFPSYFFLRHKWKGRVKLTSIFRNKLTQDWRFLSFFFSATISSKKVVVVPGVRLFCLLTLPNISFILVQDSKRSRKKYYHMPTSWKKRESPER